MTNVVNYCLKGRVVLELNLNKCLYLEYLLGEWSYFSLGISADCRIVTPSSPTNLNQEYYQNHGQQGTGSSFLKGSWRLVHPVRDLANLDVFKQHVLQGLEEEKKWKLRLKASYIIKG